MILEKHIDNRIEKARDLVMRHDLLKHNTEGVLRSRDAADQLGVSEGELVAAQIGLNVIRLGDSSKEILSAVCSLGEVMALTRNEECVHERNGVYDNASFFEHGKMSMGLFVNPDIDLRLFMNHWRFAFAVNENAHRSLQFFDSFGEAVHKVYLTNNSNADAYEQLVQQFAQVEQMPGIDVLPANPKTAGLTDGEIDWQGLRATWGALKDTHDFQSMLNKFKVGREQALRGVGGQWARPVSTDAVRVALEQARDRECEIMVFVGNRGCIQIHTGCVSKLVEYGAWYNVLDRQFNLHLREDKVARVWVTRKPTVDGIVTAVEVFNYDGGIITTLFGKRKPGEPELQLWRDIVDTLPQAA